MVYERLTEKELQALERRWLAGYRGSEDIVEGKFTESLGAPQESNADWKAICHDREVKLPNHRNDRIDWVAIGVWVGLLILVAVFWRGVWSLFP